MSQEDKRVLTVDQYEYGILIHALNDMRTGLIQEERTTDAVDDLLMKAIDAPRKKRGKGDDEAR